MHRCSRRSTLALLALAPAVVLSAPLWAAQDLEADPATELDRVTVTATRTERALAELPVVVTVIDRERMDDTLSRTIRDLLRYEPGVSVRSEFSRFGLSDVRIRGLQGNRVRIEVDGIGLPDAFSIGSFSSAGRNFVDLDTLKRVDIVRGPASSLYGSDALGGVVAFTTRDARDYIGDADGRHLQLRGGGDSVDASVWGASTAAFAQGPWSGLVNLNRSAGAQRRNQGDNDGEGGERTRPNPQDTRSHSLLAKLARSVGDDGTVELVAEELRARVDTDVLTGRTTIAGFGPPVQVLDLVGEDRQTRRRLQLQGRHDAPAAGWLDALDWRLARQVADTVQDTVESRAPLVGGQPGPVTRRERRFDFEQTVWNAEVTGFRGFALGRTEHLLAVGIDVEHSDIAQQRDGRAILPDGTVTNVISPDTFPVRDFPLSRTRTLGVYVQDEIQAGRLRLVPGLRVDRYRLSARPDPLFASRNPGIEPTGLSETSVSPKLGAVVQLTPSTALFAGYARGFRAPPYNDVNLGFTNLQFGYTALPNPDLRPETSDGYELGLRWQGQGAFAVLTGFENRYRDFIESLRALGVDPTTGLLVFQSQNVERARIRGAEFKAGLGLEAFSDALAGWSLRGALAWQQGDDRSRGQPLASVDPLTGSLGLAWDGERAGLELATRFAAGKGRLPPAPDGGEAFATPGYAVADLLLRYDLDPDIRLNLGVFNLAGRRHFQWSETPLLAADSPLIDRFTSPGRSVAASVRVQW
ncbi:MAG: TonB-dependent hemoglobin/transferrin/lactoferrin family receptor [Lysobacteraceae bacterium]